MYVYVYKYRTSLARVSLEKAYVAYSAYAILYDIRHVLGFF